MKTHFYQISPLISDIWTLYSTSSTSIIFTAVSVCEGRFETMIDINVWNLLPGLVKYTYIIYYYKYYYTVTIHINEIVMEIWIRKIFTKYLESIPWASPLTNQTKYDLTNFDWWKQGSSLCFSSEVSKLINVNLIMLLNFTKGRW